MRISPLLLFMTTIRRDGEYEVLANHRSDLLTQDLVLTGIWKYTSFKQFGLSFDFPYVRYDHQTGDISWPKWQVEEIRAKLLSEQQYENLVRSLEENKDYFRAYLRDFAGKLPLARKKPEIVKEFFEKTIAATKGIARHILELPIAEKLECEGIPPAAIRSARTETTQAIEELKEIAKKHLPEYQQIKKDSFHTFSPELTAKLQAFCKKYSHLGMKYFLGEPWTLWDAYHMLKNVDLASSSRIPKQNGEQSTTPISREISPNLRFAEDLLRLRTEKWEMMCYGCSLFRKMIKEHFVDVVNYDDLLSLRVPEVITLLSGNFFPKEGPAGRECFTLEITDNGPKLTTGIIKEKGETYALAEINGKSAYKGKVQGTIKIVLSHRDCFKVENGDILVATMSTPDFLPAMLKAAAFVTDIGGITSHAAIISREMKKPCVIGTKIATKVFHDGDLVEVDAEKGIVRKVL